ncbi:MAG: hypothetical protein JST04_07655 [Bdellovibrionales bacterium]|nr:hypothetical protein [Bdellovibrionales bacterium]
MEQDERLYEYTMGSEVYRFEARNHAEAEEMRGSAMRFFAERLATLFSEDAITGPELVPMPSGFRKIPERADDPFPGP